jgi:crotonobetainyl-CoA:carnitine CoA-transferase CaiB-like acyl-CoA transferase
MSGPLAGIKVLDLSRVLAGPWAGQLLADMGADVIKIERPGAGDDTRGWGPPFALKPDGTHSTEAAYFLSANRGKKSVAVNMTTPEGQELIRKLADTSDIVIENFKRGDLARYGLDFATLSARNPKLVYCSITGFGQTGPNADRAGYDFIIQGMAGLMSVTGSSESGPMKVGVAVTDITTGLYSTIGILAALHHARTTGQGQQIDMALFDVQLGWLANQNMNYLAGGKTPALLGNAHPNIVPYQDFPTTDRRLIVAVGNDTQFAKFCTVLGMADWATDDRFSKNASRVAHRDILVAQIAMIMETRPSAYWQAALDTAGVPCGPIQSIPDAWESDQAIARELKVHQSHPGIGTVTTAAAPIRFSETPVAYDHAPPMLGADTYAVLEQAGFSVAEIEDLQRCGAISL